MMQRLAAILARFRGQPSPAEKSEKTARESVADALVRMAAEQPDEYGDEMGRRLCRMLANLQFEDWLGTVWSALETGQPFEAKREVEAWHEWLKTQFRAHGAPVRNSLSQVYAQRILAHQQATKVFAGSTQRVSGMELPN